MTFKDETQELTPEEMAKDVFLQKYPTAYDVVLLDKTIEGAVGQDWIILDISSDLRKKIDLYEIKKRKQEKLLSSSPIFKCWVCKRTYMFLQGVEKSESITAAEKLLSDSWPVRSDGFCLHCDGGLQDESDYRGLFWTDVMRPAYEWSDLTKK